jgi:flagella basal body P-ring formation protein FlgA
MAHLVVLKQGKSAMLSLMRYTAGVLVSAAVAFLAGAPAFAEGEVETSDAIRSAVESALAPRLVTIKDAEVEIAVGPIDPRLRLPLCAAPHVSLPPTNTAIMTAKVECIGPNWSVYVPVRMHAWADAVVASVNLMPNTKLGGADLTRGRVDLFTNVGGFLTGPAQAEGKILRVGLLAGAPVLRPFLELPVAVHRGQRVLVTLTDSAMTIKTTALAMEDGRIGENIALENPETKKTIRATVADDGTVEVKF